MPDLDHGRELDSLRRRLLDAPPPEWPSLIEAIEALSRPVDADDAPPVDVPADAGRIVHVGGRVGAAVLGGPEDVEVDVRLRMARVPTGIVHLFDAEKRPLVSITLTDRTRAGKPPRVACSARVEGYSAEARWSDVIAKGAPPVNLLPTFFPDAVGRLHDVTRATLQIDVEVGKEWHTRRSQPIWLLPRSSAFRSIEDPATPGKPIDIANHLAAYVTPNAPLVMQVLRRAVEYHGAGQFDGYQSSAAGVRAQVKAIYTALRERGIAYVNSVTVYGQDPGEVVQRVRLPRESLERRSANCLDGTVLFASLLEAASLTPVLVLLERHALVGWAPAPGSTDYEFLETTSLATRSFEEAQALGKQQAVSASARKLPVPLARQDRIWPME